MRAGRATGSADALDPGMVGFPAHPAYTTDPIMVRLAQHAATLAPAMVPVVIVIAYLVTARATTTLPLVAKETPPGS